MLKASSDTQDIDPQETAEWLAALEAVKQNDGDARAAFIVSQLGGQATASLGLNTSYRNTIAPEDEPSYPGDLTLEQTIRTWVRWNAMAMVVKAQQVDSSLGGHIGSFASSATLYDVGFNHFWRGPEHPCGGDLLYVQGHISPGIYARSYLEGKLDESQLTFFRREINQPGLSSYPHPWLMPNYWQFPTVSMGLGPIQAIYRARFLKYLEARGLSETSESPNVWCFCGDGEMDEPESVGALSIASRERLDNLVFVINCNLQRLDGPVRGNGKVIQELESIFKGAGWDVLKVVWGSGWDALLDQDHDGLLQKQMDTAVDGLYQNCKAKGGAYTREHFFGADPVLKTRVAHLSDEDIWHLKRGGHDAKKVYAAYLKAVETTGKPVVILAKTVKGYGLGAAGEALNTAHNTKKLDIEALKAFRDRFNIPLSDDAVERIDFFKPEEDSPALQHYLNNRKALGGSLPARRQQADESPLPVPSLDAFAAQLKGSGDREISTTMAFVRLLATLTRDKQIGKRVVPIVPDESRTFGMEGLFRQLGIYEPSGQLYEPVDKDQVMFYKESQDGQILQEGLNEAGAFCSWIAAATSYSCHNKVMIPFYIYYSMFGFQRIGDLAWAAGDIRARGFLLGATAGRTTLNGEGLQHQDGHSHIMAQTIPNCVAYDPTFSFEVAVLIQHGLQRMVAQNEDVFFYITLMNENYTHPDMPEGAEAGIIRGMYCLAPAEQTTDLHVRLLGSGTILNEVLKAVALLSDFGVSADVFSVTSFSELGRDVSACERQSRLALENNTPYVAEQLPGDNPVIAATDYMKLYAEQVRSAITAPYTVLGTDGFGRSDTRDALRAHFEVNANHVAFAALHALFKQGKLQQKTLKDAQESLGINGDKLDPQGL